jgi:hypothetical protein
MGYDIAADRRAKALEQQTLDGEEDNPFTALVAATPSRLDQAPLSLGSQRNFSSSIIDKRPVVRSGFRNETNPCLLAATKRPLDAELSRPIPLALRQPSFSDLSQGHFVLKGQMETAPTSEFVIPDETALDPEDAPAPPAPLARDERWRSMGYEPEMDNRAKAAELAASAPLPLPLPKPARRKAPPAAPVAEVAMPERLRAMLKHPLDSPVYKALMGESVTGLTEPQITETIAVLRQYLRKCISRGYIAECGYVNGRIARVQEQRAELQKPDVQEESEQARAELADAQAMLDTREHAWRTKLARLDAEEEIAVHDVERRWDCAERALAAEWRSEKIRSRFDKPSSLLIALRADARRHLLAHRFNEAAQISSQAVALEEAEAHAASERMRLSYGAARARLDAKFRKEMEIMNAGFLAKRSHLEKKRNRKMLSLSRHLQICQQKSDALARIIRGREVRRV